jgi:AcrR family transcriptional regulator
MARESGKRRAKARPARRGAKASNAKGARARSSQAAAAALELVPQTERAPGRGKYDRSRTPNERLEEQKARLLDAAAHVFAEMGWADATVEAIVTRAGMSRRTFYEHFDDLRHCLLELHQRATRRAFKAVETAVENASTPVEQLQMGVAGFLGGIAMFPHVAKVLLRVARSAGAEFEKAHEQMMARFEKLVHDGVADAYATRRCELPPDELRVYALVAAMEAVALRYVMRGEEAKAMEAAPVLIDLVQRAFGRVPST